MYFNKAKLTQAHNHTLQRLVFHQKSSRWNLGVTHDILREEGQGENIERYQQTRVHCVGYTICIHNLFPDQLELAFDLNLDI